MIFPVTNGLLLNLDARSGLFQDSALITPAVADGDPVGGWVDPINGFNATQSSNSIRPTLKLNVLNGLSAIRFDGATTFLSLGQPAGLTAGLAKDFTVYVRFVPRNAGNGSAQYQTIFARTTAASRRLFLLVTGQQVSNFGGSTPVAPRGLTDGGLTDASLRYFSGTESVGNNGSYGAGANTEAIEACDIRIGSAGNTAGTTQYPGQHDVLSLQVFSGALSNAEMAQIDQYYRAVNSEPATFPYLFGIDGNSIAWGQNASEGQGWAQQLAAALGIPHYAIFDCGIQGQTIANMASGAAVRVDPAFAQANVPCVLFATEYVNDMRTPGGLTPANAYTGFKSYMAARLAANPGLKLIGATCTPNGYDNASDITTLNGLIRADCPTLANGSPYVYLPGSGVVCCNAMIDLNAWPALSDKSNTTYYVDGTHPTTAGHAQYAAAVSSVLQYLFPSGIAGNSTAAQVWTAIASQSNTPGSFGALVAGSLSASQTFNGLSLTSILEVLVAAFVTGRAAVVNNGNGTSTITRYKQDGATAKYSVTFKPDGTVTGASILS